MAKTRSKMDGLLNRDDGVVAIEFIVTLPLILAAMVFSFEFGRLVFAYEIAGQDMRNALRYLSRAETADLSNTSGGYVVAAQNYAKTGSPTTTPNCPKDYEGGYSATNCHFPWTSSSTISVSTTPFSTPSYNVDGSVITMNATVDVPLATLWFLGRPTYTINISDQGPYIGD